MNLKDFPNRYSGSKNCFDCKNFVCRIPIQRKSGMLIYGASTVRCKFNNLLLGVTKAEHIREAIYKFKNMTWWKINKEGWRHKNWAYANVCDDFESMVDDPKEITIKLTDDKIKKAEKWLLETGICG